MNQIEWFKHNDEVAQKAMKRVGVWYQPPYYRAFDEPSPPEAQPGPEATEPAPTLPELAPPLPPQRRTFLPRSRGLQIVAAAAKVCELEANDIIGPSRRRVHVRARQAVMWLLVRRLGYSSPQAGRVFKRDHSTVFHGVRSVDSNPDRYVPTINAIIARLKADGIWDDMARSG